MGLGRTRAVALLGVTGSPVEVEAHVAASLPAFQIVGLPDASLNEAPARIRAGCASQGVPLAPQKITVNLTPTALPKHGSGFDLAIAVATLAAFAEIDPQACCDVVHIGELGLDGRLRPVRGVLPCVQAAVLAGFTRVVVASGNAAEARLVRGAQVFGAANLSDVVRLYGGPRGKRSLVPEGAQEPVAATSPEHRTPPQSPPDLADVVGQPVGRRAVEVAAAGGHHLLLLGPPGAGKTMLASRLPGLLPDLNEQDALAVTAVHSLAGTFEPLDGLLVRPPFEEPHHSATTVAVIGGGQGFPRPGAASRAHGGVLFLDEAPEFARGVLDALRQPLETAELVISRARGSAVFPARFQLVLAANPCPCGRAVGRGLDCTCTPLDKRRYAARLSGPVLDRIDVRVEVDAPSAVDVLTGEPGEPSAVVAARVAQARRIQHDRWSRHCPPGAVWPDNAHVPGPVLRGEVRLPGGVTRDLDRALDRGVLTLRGYDRVLRLAWTLADLSTAGVPDRDHVGEALTLRSASWA